VCALLSTYLPFSSQRAGRGLELGDPNDAQDLRVP
jgi:hypothetical protein